MTTFEDKLVLLADRLLKATEAGRLDWKRDENASDIAYYVQLGENFAVIASRDSDDRHPYVLRIEDTEDREIERLDTDIPNDDERAPSIDGWQSILAELYRRAKRRTTNVDGIVDAMIDKVPE